MISLFATLLLQASFLGFSPASTHLAPAADPVQHWRLSEADYSAGSFASQIEGRSLECLLLPEFIGTGESSAVLFSKGGSYLVANDAARPAELPEKAISIEAWVAIDEVSNWGGFIGALTDDGDDEAGWILGYRGPQFIFGLATEGGGKLTYLGSEQTYRPGRWYHVVGTYDGKLQRIYVDGVLEAESEAQSGALHYKDRQHFVVGAYKDSNEEFPLVGALHDVKLHDRALSERKVRNSFKELDGKLPDPPGLTFTGIGAPQTAEVRVLQPAIDAAIDRGVEFILQEQHRDGSWEHHLDGYRNGQTALCTYTLLKSGLPPEHPAIVRAFDFMRRVPPKKSYSMGFQLLAIAATNDTAHKAWVRELVEELLDWEHHEHRGSWAYPDAGVDLSNTQIIVLGLWAASKLGVEAPKDVWKRLVRHTLDHHQEEPLEVEWGAAGRSGSRRIAGFNYYRDAQKGSATGSMTAAGLCILSLAEHVTGKSLGGRMLKEIHAGTRLGLDWLDYHWAVDRNPGNGNPGRLYYYLYGVERVGALFGLETLGKHEWYAEGAQFLIEKQSGEGTWGNQAETCFAVLFLSRATEGKRPVSGENAATKKTPNVHLTEDGPVRLKATGQGQLVLYVDGFSQELLESFGQQGAKRADLRITKVEYLVDGEVFESQVADSRRPWGGQRFAVKYQPKSQGERAFQVRLTAIPAGADPRAGYEEQLIESEELYITTELTAKMWMQRMIELSQENVLRGRELTRVQCSTKSADAHGAAMAVDGLEATRWVCAANDREPRLRITLKKPLRAKHVLLTPATSRQSLRGQFDRVTKLSVAINGDDPVVIEVPADLDDLDPILIPLQKRPRVQSIEVRILERESSGSSAGLAGFAEVGLVN